MVVLSACGAGAKTVSADRPSSTQTTTAAPPSTIKQTKQEIQQHHEAGTDPCVRLSTFMDQPEITPAETRQLSPSEQAAINSNERDIAHTRDKLYDSIEFGRRIDLSRVGFGGVNIGLDLINSI